MTHWQPFPKQRSQNLEIAKLLKTELLEKFKLLDKRRFELMEKRRGKGFLTPSQCPFMNCT